MGTDEFTAGGNSAMDQHSIQGGVEILLVASCYGNRDKLRSDGPLGSNADFFIYILVAVVFIFVVVAACCCTTYTDGVHVNKN